MHKFLGGTGITGEDVIFFDKVNFDTEIIERDSIFDIAVESVSLFHQEDTT
jgi:hypothetical protein